LFDKKIVRPLIQIHDEMIYEISNDQAKIIIPRIKATMESVASLRVPLVVDAKVGRRWGEMKKL